MKTFAKTFAKGGIATAAVGAMALAGATPAQARGHDDGISVGEVIAGAVIIGGIAAVASAASRDRDYYRGDRYYRDGRYYNNGNDYRRNAYASRGNPRAAVERCGDCDLQLQCSSNLPLVNLQQSACSGVVAAVKIKISWIRMFVPDLGQVDDTRYGWKVKGRMVVDGSYAGGRYDRYGYRDRNNRYQRWNDRDSGNFTCRIERGRVADLDFSGIRGLR